MALKPCQAQVAGRCGRVVVLRCLSPGARPQPRNHSTGIAWSCQIPAPGVSGWFHRPRYAAAPCPMSRLDSSRTHKRAFYRTRIDPSNRHIQPSADRSARALRGKVPRPCRLVIRQRPGRAAFPAPTPYSMRTRPWCQIGPLLAIRLVATIPEIGAQHGQAISQSHRVRVTMVSARGCAHLCHPLDPPSRRRLEYPGHRKRV
jgi:hypothetical protein